MSLEKNCFVPPLVWRRALNVLPKKQNANASALSKKSNGYCALPRSHSLLMPIVGPTTGIAAIGDTER